MVAFLGDSLVVELPALDRATLVRIQVPQPLKQMIKLNVKNSLAIRLSHKFKNLIPGRLFHGGLYSSICTSEFLLQVAPDF
jgi:hypothetical protein